MSLCYCLRHLRVCFAFILPFSGIFFLHPVRHSCAWAPWSSQWHTQAHAAQTHSCTALEYTHTHTQRLTIKQHKRGFEGQRLLRKQRSFTQGCHGYANDARAPMCVRVCAQPMWSVCMYVWGCRRKWDSAREVRKMDEQRWRSKHGNAAQEENRSRCRHHGTKHTKTHPSVPKVV